MPCSTLPSEGASTAAFALPRVALVGQHSSGVPCSTTHARLLHHQGGKRSVLSRTVATVAQEKMAVTAEPLARPMRCDQPHDGGVIAADGAYSRSASRPGTSVATLARAGQQEAGINKEAGLSTRDPCS